MDFAVAQGKNRGNNWSISRFFKEALIKSTCADLRQKFLLARKKSAGILGVFQTFLTLSSRNLWREDAHGDLISGSLTRQDGKKPGQTAFNGYEYRFPKIGIS